MLPEKNRICLYQVLKVYQVALKFCVSQPSRQIKCTCQKSEFHFAVRSESQIPTTFECLCNQKANKNHQNDKFKIHKAEDLNEITKYLLKNKIGIPRKLKRHVQCVFNDCQNLSKKLGCSLVKWNVFSCPDTFSLKSSDNLIGSQEIDNSLGDLIDNVIFSFHKFRNRNVCLKKMKNLNQVSKVVCSKCDSLLALVNRKQTTVLTLKASESAFI